MRVQMILANRTESNPDGNMNLLQAGIYSVPVASFPVHLPCSVAVCFEAEFEEQLAFAYAFRCIDEDGHDVWRRLERNIELAGTLPHASACIDLLGTFPRPGSYAFTIVCDGHEVNRLPLTLRLDGSSA